MNKEEYIYNLLDKLDLDEWCTDLYKVPLTWSELYDIRDYVNSLQQENKQLEETNKVLSQELTKDKILKQDCLTTCCGIPLGDIPKLKERIDKAIEYTNRFVNGKNSIIDDFRNVELVLENIAEILKGDM